MKKNIILGSLAAGLILSNSTMAADAPGSTTQTTPPASAAVSSKPALDPSAFDAALNDNQKKVIAWTNRQFRSFFDARTFDGWSEKEKGELETKLIDTLKGPVTRDYYTAIGSLGALKSQKALPALMAIATERADKNNRDRWMAIRALGMLGDKTVMPELIHLVYHGNPNTRWWAQITLVRLSGKNFGSDWNAWGQWWKDSGGKPAWNPEIVRWWQGQPDNDKLAEDLAENDKKFLSGI